MLETGLDGKVVLITGANSPYGIGAAAARAFAAQGAAVFITYLRQLADRSPQAAGAQRRGNHPARARRPARRRGRRDAAAGRRAGALDHRAGDLCRGRAPDGVTTTYQHIRS